MSELKPCPFCVGDPEIDSRRSYRNISTDNPETGCAIYCTGCGAQMMICYSDVWDWPREDVAAHLTEAWNKRADDAQITALKAELAEAKAFFEAACQQSVDDHKFYCAKLAAAQATIADLEAHHAQDHDQAYTRVQSLEATIEKMREALEEIANDVETYSCRTIS